MVFLIDTECVSFQRSVITHTRTHTHTHTPHYFTTLCAVFCVKHVSCVPVIEKSTLSPKLSREAQFQTSVENESTHPAEPPKRNLTGLGMVPGCADMSVAHW